MNPTWTSDCGTVKLWLADCCEVLPTLERADCVITDPPYGINTKSDGNGKLNPWADLCNSAFWYAHWIRECRRIVPNGCLWTFLNWRSLVTFQKAACDIAWPIESLLVWNKAWIGPGGSRGLRPSYELVALFVSGEFGLEDRGLADIQTWNWSSQKPNGHPAEKPIDAMRWLVTNSTSVAGTVVDPFMGSGTTGTACVKEGRSFCGIETDPRWFEVAKARISDELIKKTGNYKADPAKYPLLAMGDTP